MASPEQNVIEALQKIGIPYEIINIDPEFSDTAAFCERYAYPPKHTCNTIIVVSKRGPKKHVACVILANTKLDVNKRVKNLLGTSKASFATSDEVAELTGMVMGGVTPFSLPAELLLYVDERIMSREWVVLGGGSRGTKIKITPEVFRKLGAEIVSDLALGD
jgi:prolyl-tRNA editing enzyme YbaK/EbsC (Cys-tRNA(Pro) deacylase)